MVVKFIIFSLLVASVCGSGGYSSFSYGVSDPKTGDVKDQHEKRVGDSVVGKYSLLEADGSKRIVEYEANAATGFNAVVRKEPAGGVQPSGPLAHEPLAYPSNGPIAPSHPVSVAPVIPQAHPGLAGYSAGLPNLGTLSGALPHPGASLNPSGLGYPGALNQKGSLGHLGALQHSAAQAHQEALAHHGPLSHPAAIGSFAQPSGIAHPSAINSHVNHLPSSYARPGYAPFSGANGYSKPATGPQGVPSVSHYSHSVVHEAPRAYPGPYAGAHNGAYDGAYSGAYGGYGGAYGGYGALGQKGAFGAPLIHGLATPLGHGIAGPRGAAHSYNSLTRGEAYPHGYGGYGAHSKGAYGSGIGSGLGAGLRW